MKHVLYIYIYIYIIQQIFFLFEKGKIYKYNKN
jgi:hypothetical protein